MVSYDQYGNVKLQNSLQLRMGLFFFAGIPQHVRVYTN